MSIEMRPVKPEEFDTFVTATFIGFGAPVAPPEDTANTKALCEYDRTLASFDGEEIVSTTGIFSFDMTVPGGSPHRGAGRASTVGFRNKRWCRLAHPVSAT